MTVDIAAHTRYGAEVAKYQTARQAATVAGDENALAKANADWTVARAEMQMELVDEQQSDLGKRQRLSEIKQKYPQVPDAALEGITDLDQAERIAKAFQDIAVTRPTQGEPKGGGTWSPPPGGGGTASDPEDFVDPNEQRDGDTGILPSIQRRMDKIAPEVMAKGALSRVQNEELQRLSLEPLTSRFQGRQQR